MGTNYYWNTDLCGECGRYESKHIGKNLTMFQGYFEEGIWDHDVPTISSWQDWKRVILTTEGTVVAEHRTEYSGEEFVEMVEATDRKDRRRQYDWIVNDNRKNPSYPHKLGIGRNSDWLDADGFSFTGSEFS